MAIGLEGHIICHDRQLSPYPEKGQLSFRYLARASVGRKISDGGGRGTPSCRREWQGSFRSKSADNLWIVKHFQTLVMSAYIASASIWICGSSVNLPYLMVGHELTSVRKLKG